MAMQRALRYLALPGPMDWICCHLPLLRADTKSDHSDHDHAALAPAFMKTLFNRSPYTCPVKNHNVKLADSLVSETTMSSEGLKSVWQMYIFTSFYGLINEKEYIRFRVREQSMACFLKSDTIWHIVCSVLFWLLESLALN